MIEPAASASAAAKTAEGKRPEDKGPCLLRRGNPLRWTRGGITAATAGFLALLLMAKPGQWRWGVPMGAVLVAIASWGVMDLLGTFDDADDRLARSTSLRDLAPSLASVIATFLVFLFALGGAQAGWVLPQLAWGIVVTLAFVGLVVAVFAFGKRLGPWALDENGEDRPRWNRHRASGLPRGPQPEFPPPRGPKSEAPSQALVLRAISC